MPGRRVVITGMAALTALSQHLEGFWEGLCEGRSGISRIERFDTARFKTHFGGEMKAFDAAPLIDPREQKRLDRFSQYGLVAAIRAVNDSGIQFEREDPYLCGVIIGSGVGGLDQLEEAHERLTENPVRLSPLLIPRMMVNAASGHVSIRYGLRGPISAVATACASASNAIGDAFIAIQRGDADVMVSGGSEAAVTPLAVGGFNAMRALSQNNDNPQEASRPFDRDRDGFVLSEGAGVVVLEDLDHARRRNARIYAEVLGYGSTSDAGHLTAPDPEGRGAGRAMLQALRDARINKDDIEYVNAHGTGTPLGDKAETAAIKLVFGAHARHMMISSTKSQLGHLLGASGGVGMVATAKSLYHGVLPPTINLHTPDPDCDLDYVPNSARCKIIQHAMVNSFGFGGHNASIVLGAFDRHVAIQRMAA